VVAGQVHLHIAGPLHGRSRVLWVDDVLGDIDQHWAGSTGGGDVKGLLDRPGDVLGLGDQKIVFGDRHGDSGGVALLEGVGADGW
jgi:hypothetical protein